MSVEMGEYGSVERDTHGISVELDRDPPLVCRECDGAELGSGVTINLIVWINCCKPLDNKSVDN